MIKHPEFKRFHDVVTEKTGYVPFKRPSEEEIAKKLNEFSPRKLHDYGNRKHPTNAKKTEGETETKKFRMEQQTSEEDKIYEEIFSKGFDEN